MSFSSETKDELCSLEIMSPCCYHAMSYGLLLFGRSFSSASVNFVTVHAVVAELYSKIVTEICGEAPSSTLSKGGKITLSVDREDARKKILRHFGHAERSVALRINRANIADDCCFASFFRGAFLSCGTVSSPEKDYHLEFVVPYLKLSGDLVKLAEELNFYPKIVQRKGSYVIYAKESVAIEDTLITMGAQNSAFRIMEIKVEKDVRNKVNRRVNFETANIGRSVDAAVEQCEAIKKIIKCGKFDSLSPELRELANLRTENPESSLKELSDMLSVSLSRSGVYHRLNKLIEIATNIEE